MYQSEGPYRGYFAWHCTPQGQQLAANPASDGEEWFVMALLFAAGRWGNGEGIYNYQEQAQQILDTMLHKSEENNGLATNMFDTQTRQVVFVPSGRNATFTDPSYHLPAYYELWARWAARDNEFWAEAAQASRDFFHCAAHPQTGLMPDYANFDGTPVSDPEHEDFRFDAWRTLANVAVDYAWFAADPWQVEQSNRVLGFLLSQGVDTFPNQYTLDGQPLSADHSTGLVAMDVLSFRLCGRLVFLQASGVTTMACYICWPCFMSAAISKSMHRPPEGELPGHAAGLPADCHLTVPKATDLSR
jgi:oligosaccharide reducing-end xylanase